MKKMFNCIILIVCSIFIISCREEIRFDGQVKNDNQTVLLNKDTIFRSIDFFNNDILITAYNAVLVDNPKQYVITVTDKRTQKVEKVITIEEQFGTR